MVSEDPALLLREGRTPCQCYYSRLMLIPLSFNSNPHSNQSAQGIHSFLKNHLCLGLEPTTNFSGGSDGLRLMSLCFWNLGFSGILHSVRVGEQCSQRDERSPARRAGVITELARRSAVAYHCPKHHRPRALQTAPVRQIPPFEGALDADLNFVEIELKRTPVGLEERCRKASPVETPRAERAKKRYRDRRGERKHRPQRQRQGRTLA